MEFPVFEFPLHDTTASAGADVLLKCIIAGAPTPEGKQVHLMFPQMESSYNERFWFYILYILSFLCFSDLDKRQQECHQRGKLHSQSRG